MGLTFIYSSSMETTTTTNPKQKMVKKQSIMQKLIKAEPEIFSVLKSGDLVEAEFIGQGQGGAYFNVNNFSTGVVYGRELLNAKEIIKKLEAGEIINAKVVEIDNDHGYTELSLTEADKQKVWQELKEAKDKGDVVTVKINGANSGGLMSEINGVKAFLPVSQLSNQNYPRISNSDNEKEMIYEELKKFVDQDMQVKILTVNSKSNKLIVSEREITDENVQELLKKYDVGSVVDGVISGVADFGAFLRFQNDPEIQGLIHISELDHKLVENPKEIVSVGDEVQAKIVEIKEGRVSLSLKALKEDPWENLKDKFEIGQEVKGMPFKYNPFGAFINVEGAQVQGLIHVSEFGGVDEMKKEIKLDKFYDFVIDTIKPDEKRLILKLKDKENPKTEKIEDKEEGSE